ncbi:MAG: glutaredoxin family protein [Betaproteobacteria bacterium]
MLVLAGAHAETLYKVIGADGKTTYTDRPAADAKSTTALKFSDAPSTPLPDSVLKFQAELQKSSQGRLALAKRLDAIGTVTLFSASWCGYCTKAKAYLRTKGISFQEHDIDTPGGGRAYFEAGGKRGVPLLMADGKRLEGFSDGAYDHFFVAKK